MDESITKLKEEIQKLKLEKMVEEAVEEALEQTKKTYKQVESVSDNDDSVVETIVKHKHTLSKTIKSLIAGIVMLGTSISTDIMDGMLDNASSAIEFTIEELKDLDAMIKKFDNSIKK